jgi:predicted SAM-dependent methyltransferase
MSMTLLNLGCGGRRHHGFTNADLRPESPEVLEIDLRQPLPFLDGEFDGVYCSHVLEHLSPGAGRRLMAEVARVLRPGGIVRVVVPDLEGICRAYLAALEAAERGEADALDRHAWMTLELVDQMTRDRRGGLMLRWWQRDPVPVESFVLSRMGEEARDTIEHFRRRRRETGRAPVPDATWDDPDEIDEEARRRYAASGESHRWMYDRVSLASLLAGAGFTRARRVGPLESAIPGWADFHLDADAEGRPHKADSLWMEAVRG